MFVSWTDNCDMTLMPPRGRVERGWIAAAFRRRRHWCQLWWHLPRWRFTAGSGLQPCNSRIDFPLDFGQRTQGLVSMRYSRDSVAGGIPVHGAKSCGAGDVTEDMSQSVTFIVVPEFERKMHEALSFHQFRDGQTIGGEFRFNEG